MIIYNFAKKQNNSKQNVLMEQNHKTSYMKKNCSRNSSSAVCNIKYKLQSSSLVKYTIIFFDARNIV